MKVASALGEHPFIFRRLERRQGGVALVGTIAGLEASLLLDRDDLRASARALAAPLAAAALLACWLACRRRRG